MAIEIQQIFVLYFLCSSYVMTMKNEGSFSHLKWKNHCQKNIVFHTQIVSNTRMCANLCNSRSICISFNVFSMDSNSSKKCELIRDSNGNSNYAYMEGGKFYQKIGKCLCGRNSDCIMTSNSGHYCRCRQWTKYVGIDCDQDMFKKIDNHKSTSTVLKTYTIQNNGLYCKERCLIHGNCGGYNLRKDGKQCDLIERGISPIDPNNDYEVYELNDHYYDILYGK